MDKQKERDAVAYKSKNPVLFRRNTDQIKDSQSCQRKYDTKLCNA